MAVTFDGHELSVDDLFLDCRGRLFRVSSVSRMMSLYNVVSAYEARLTRKGLTCTAEERSYRTEATVWAQEDEVTRHRDWKDLYEFKAQPHRPAAKVALLERKHALHERIGLR